jgi:hypothetical protein
MSHSGAHSELKWCGWCVNINSRDWGLACDVWAMRVLLSHMHVIAGRLVAWKQPLAVSWTQRSELRLDTCLSSLCCHSSYSSCNRLSLWLARAAKTAVPVMVTWPPALTHWLSIFHLNLSATSCRNRCSPEESSSWGPWWVDLPSPHMATSGPQNLYLIAKYGSMRQMQGTTGAALTGVWRHLQHEVRMGRILVNVATQKLMLCWTRCTFSQVKSCGLECVFSWAVECGAEVQQFLSAREWIMLCLSRVMHMTSSAVHLVSITHPAFDLVRTGWVHVLVTVLYTQLRLHAVITKTYCLSSFQNQIRKKVTYYGIEQSIPTNAHRHIMSIVSFINSLPQYVFRRVYIAIFRGSLKFINIDQYL